MKVQYLYGINPVLAAITANRRKLLRLFMAEPRGEKHKIISRANEIGLKVEGMSKDNIENYAKNKPHQGVILKTHEIYPIGIEGIEDIGQDEGQLWLCLDQINDPQNLGSILRAAHFFNADGVILTSKGTSPLSPAVAKVSSGAVEWMKIVEVADLPAFLKNAKVGGWKVVGSGIGKDIKEIKRSGKMMVVFGNEGEGIRDRVRKECEELFWVPGGSGTVDSLNVAAAVSVFLDRLRA